MSCPSVERRVVLDIFLYGFILVYETLRKLYSIIEIFIYISDHFVILTRYLFRSKKESMILWALFSLGYLFGVMVTCVVLRGGEEVVINEAMIPVVDTNGYDSWAVFRQLTQINTSPLGNLGTSTFSKIQEQPILIPQREPVEISGNIQLIQGIQG